MRAVDEGRSSCGRKERSKNNEQITQLTPLMPIWGLALRPLSGVLPANPAPPEGRQPPLVSLLAEQRDLATKRRCKRTRETLGVSLRYSFGSALLLDLL